MCSLASGWPATALTTRYGTSDVIPVPAIAFRRTDTFFFLSLEMLSLGVLPHAAPSLHVKSPGSYAGERETTWKSTEGTRHESEETT